MIEEIFRKYLEIKSIDYLNEVEKPSKSYSLNLIEPKDFQLNKFLYKQIGKKYHWIDRLSWTDANWIAYVSNKNVITYLLKDNDDLVGYCELIFDREKKRN